jgi:hypothetical protein
LFRKRVQWWALVSCFIGIATAAQATPREVIFSSSYADEDDFESFARQAKEAGATHIDITPSLPWSFWEYDMPGDPYPSWVISNCSLLKLARPPALAKYIPSEHSEAVVSLLESRCAVLRRLGLKAQLSANEPNMLPEAVFTDHPLWRGARVDHPARSRVARFAPSIDNPEVLALFREATAMLLRKCPEIDLLDLATNDSGAGLDWSPGTYAGAFGNTLYRDRSMDERLAGFFAAIRAGAREVGSDVDVRMWLTREPEPMRIARKLEKGNAIENLEGPTGTPFWARAEVSEGYGSSFYPVTGIPRPIRFLRGLVSTLQSSAPRLFINMGDRGNRVLYFEIYNSFRSHRIDTSIQQMALLRNVAARRAGEPEADDLLRVWQAIDDADQLARLLDAGGFIFNLGGVQQRWLIRPFVPFPNELAPEEKAYFRPFLFQALDEANAETLADVQGTDVYRGWSGRHFVRRVVGAIERDLHDAVRLAGKLQDADLERRLRIFLCVARNARNAVSYQAQLDRVKSLGHEPVPNPVVGTRSDWDRELILLTVREELDNTAVLIELLGERPDNYLLLAKTPKEEDIRSMSPEIVTQLRKKLNITNAHWEDYKRLFTTPNW